MNVQSGAILAGSLAVARSDRVCTRRVQPHPKRRRCALPSSRMTAARRSRARRWGLSGSAPILSAALAPRRRQPQ